MASNAAPSEADCTCPICCDLFTNPVLLLCGHSFCMACIQECWRLNNKICPVCRKLFPLSNPPQNLALRNVSDILRQEKNRAALELGEMCGLHDEKLKLFCQDHQELICVICRDAKEHKKHNCVPINEAAGEFRTKVNIELMYLKTKLGLAKDQKLYCDGMATHIEAQAQQTEKSMKKEFQKLYQLLKAEEDARIYALRKEAVLKRDTMKIRMTNWSTEIATLTNKIQTIEREMKAKDTLFIQNIKMTMESSQYKMPDTVKLPGALIDEAKHLGNLQFSVWKKMSATIQYTPVILDPNTGCSSLTISKNLTCLTESKTRSPFPNNPERMYLYDILGHESISSGKHSWDVEVDGYWGVGVTTPCDHPRIWGIYMCRCTGVLRELNDRHYTESVSENVFPQKVRVELDYDGGVISFFDLGRKTPVHTIKYNFKEKVIPYFQGKAKILPAELLVNIKPSGFTSNDLLVN